MAFCAVYGYILLWLRVKEREQSRQNETEKCSSPVLCARYCDIIIILDLDFNWQLSTSLCTALTLLTVINDMSFTVLKPQRWLSRSLLRSSVCMHVLDLQRILCGMPARHLFFTFTSYEFDSSESSDSRVFLHFMGLPMCCYTINDSQRHSTTKDERSIWNAQYAGITMGLSVHFLLSFRNCYIILEYIKR